MVTIKLLPMVLAAAALSTSVAVGAQPRSPSGIASLHGFCNKLIAFDKDVTDRCDDKVANTEYTDGRDSFTFMSEDAALIVTFSGDGKKQIHQGPDVAVQPVDMIISNFKGQITTIKAVGNCRFTNPYKGKANITCDADTAQGQFGGGFTTDGSEPETKRFP